MQYFDQHIHTKYSHDSKAKLEDYINLAISKGQSNIVFTDHCDIYTSDTPFSYYSNFEKQSDEIKQLQIKYPHIHIMQGIEIGFNETAIPQQMEIISKIKASLINLSIHYYKTLDFYVCNYKTKEETDELMRLYLRHAKHAAEVFPDYDVFCHIDYGFKNAVNQISTLNFTDYENELIDLFKAIIKRDKVLEINTKVQEKIDDNHSHLRYFLKLYKQLGGTKISLSSDAHSVDEYNREFEKYIKIIKEEGFTRLYYFVDRVRYEYEID